MTEIIHWIVIPCLMAVSAGVALGDDGEQPGKTSSLDRLLAISVLDEADADVPRQRAPYSGFVTFELENDFFTGNDDGYTNGWRLTYTSDELELEGEDYSLEGLVEAFSFLPFIGDSEYRHHYTISAGQVMATPEDIELENPPEGSQPYFGLLFLSGGLVARSEKSMHVYELLAGFTGDWSLAEETQTVVHDMIGSEEPEGWDHQIHTEPVLNLNYRYIHQLYRSGTDEYAFDILPIVGGGVGNMYIGAFTGCTFRFGYDLPYNFGPNIIRGGAERMSIHSQLPQPIKEWAWSIHAGFAGNWVGRDLALDGNTFRDYDRDVSKEEFWGGALAGFGVRYWDWLFSIDWIYMTDRIEDQDEDTKFGALSIERRF